MRLHLISIKLFGILFCHARLPKSSYELTEKITFSSSHPQRRFIRVPESATYAGEFYLALVMISASLLMHVALLFCDG